MMNTRTDIHRPSEIIPSDYSYVAVQTMNITGIGEREAAGPVPTGRVLMTGVVVGTKTVAAFRGEGDCTKLIIKLENGSKVYGSCFANLSKGDTVTFTATVEASKDDAKFGFYKRPSLPVVPPTDAQKRTKKGIAKLNRIMKAAGLIDAKGAPISAYDQQNNGTPELWNAYIELSDLQSKLYTESEAS